MKLRGGIMTIVRDRAYPGSGRLFEELWQNRVIQLGIGNIQPPPHAGTTGHDRGERTVLVGICLDHSGVCVKPHDLGFAPGLAEGADKKLRMTRLYDQPEAVDGNAVPHEAGIELFNKVGCLVCVLGFGEQPLHRGVCPVGNLFPFRFVDAFPACKLAVHTVG